MSDKMDSAIASDTRECPRTLAVWKPGQAIEGVGHRYSWTGTVPCTGRYACILCGRDAPRA